MQKHLLYSAVALAALAMGSCSKEDTMNGGMPETTDASQVIEIAVENAGDGLTTRAGRPLLSSEAKQTIDNVAIIICDKSSNNVKTVKLIENWQTESEAYDDASGHGRKIRFTLDEEKKLQKGEYIVYALGYYGLGGTDSQYTYNDQPLNDYLKTVQAGATFNKDIVIKNANEDNAEELFAGAAEFQVDKTGNFSQGVTLHRQVAGMYTYAYNVPYFKDAKYLNVYASQESQDMVLGNFYTDVLGGNGENNALKNVINGTNLNANKTLIYQIELNQWFTNIVDVNNDGIIDTYTYEYDNNGGLNENKESHNWHKPNDNGGVFGNVTLVKGSVFGGEFIIPFAAKAGENTFTLELTDGSNSALRTWSVKLPSDQVPESLISWSGTSWSAPTEVTESASAFSVLRNHLYSIGSKAAEGTGEDKEDPDEPDNPQDLSTKQDIMLQVNDNWELIHQMVVD